MNRIGKKEIAADAAKLFEREVLGMDPGVPRGNLCAMVDEYVYYQTDELTKEEAREIVDRTCRKPVRRY